MALFKRRYEDNAKAVELLLSKERGETTDSEVVNRFAGWVHEDAKAHPDNPPENPSSGKLLIEIKTLGLASPVWAEGGSVNLKLMFKKDTRVQFCLDLEDKSGTKVKNLYLERKGASGFEEDFHCTDIAEAVSLASLPEPYANTDAVKMLENAAGKLDFTANRPRRFAGIVKEEPKDYMHRLPNGRLTPNGSLNIIIESPSLKSTVKAMAGRNDAGLRHYYKKGTHVQFNLDVREKNGEKAGSVWFRVKFSHDSDMPQPDANWRHNMKME